MGVTDLSAVENRFERILIYGAPKTGKTRFATSLPPRWGEIVYVAADPTSERLDSIFPAIRPRFHVVGSRPKAGELYNPRTDAFVMAQETWRARFAGVKTIVWDTITATGWDILVSIADQGSFSESKHIIMGSKATKDLQSIPMQGDYMAAQNAIDRITTFLFLQPLNVIVVAHEGYKEAQEAGSKTLTGGPLTVGSATIGSYAGRFPTCIRLTRQSTGYGKDAKPKITAWTETQNIWLAGIRSGHDYNPMPVCDLQPNPINFWLEHDRHFAPAQPAQAREGVSG